MITTLILALLQEYPYAYSPVFQILKNTDMANSSILTSISRLYLNMVLNKTLHWEERVSQLKLHLPLLYKINPLLKKKDREGI